jgi:hypothetical protein
MDSFRIYEALEAGCIPITLKNSKQFKLHPSYWHGVFRKGESNLPIVEEEWEDCLKYIKKVSGDQIKSLKEKSKSTWETGKTYWKNEMKSLIYKLKQL